MSTRSPTIATFATPDTPNRPRHLRLRPGFAYSTDYSNRAYARRLADPDWLDTELDRIDDLIRSGLILDSGSQTTILGRRAYICSCRGFTCRFFRVHLKRLSSFFTRVKYLCELQAI